MAWNFEFYLADSDGKRSRGEKVSDGSVCMQTAVTNAKAIMEHLIFPFGKANMCLVKCMEGKMVQVVVPDAPLEGATR